MPSFLATEHLVLLDRPQPRNLLATPVLAHLGTSQGSVASGDVGSDVSEFYSVEQSPVVVRVI